MPEETESAVQPSTETEASTDQAVQPGGSPETPSLFEDGFDPTTLPDELQGAYKNMERGFHEKTQSLAQEKRDLEALRQKSQAYDAILNHPEARQYLANLASGKRPQAEPEKTRVDDRISEILSTDTSDKTESELVALQAELADLKTQQMREQILGEIQPILDNQVNTVMTQTLQSIKQTLSSKYKDFGDYEGEIVRRLGTLNPQTNRTYARDYFEAGLDAQGRSQLQGVIESMYRDMAFDKVQATIEQKADERIVAKQNANLIPSGGTTTQVTHPQESQNTSKSLREKWASAWEEQKKRLGIEDVSKLPMH